MKIACRLINLITRKIAWFILVKKFTCMPKIWFNKDNLTTYKSLKTNIDCLMKKKN